jgi:hypothetical protein
LISVLKRAGQLCPLLSVKRATERAELDETIRVLTRSLANAHGIPASYPPPLM